jgi:fusion and transport protein UGO1
VQSAAPRHRKYGGLINGLSKFSAEEGYSTAFAAPILSASILYHGLVCFFKNSPPLIINRILGISGQDAPVLYALCELVINITELIVLLPVETARRRLFCQPRPRILVDDRPFRPLVELRPLPYTGVIDCMKSVIAEEGGLRHRTRRGGRRRPSTDAVGGSRPWWDGFGLKGLYRGVKEHFWATVGLLVVSALQVIDDEEF